MPTPLRPSLAPYEAYPLFEALQRTASRLPDKTAVIDGDRTFTFAQLDDQSDRFAAALNGSRCGRRETGSASIRPQTAPSSLPPTSASLRPAQS